MPVGVIFDIATGGRTAMFKLVFFVVSNELWVMEQSSPLTLISQSSNHLFLMLKMFE